MENKCIEIISKAFEKLQNESKDSFTGEKKTISLPASPKSIIKSHSNITSMIKVISQ